MEIKEFQNSRNSRLAEFQKEYNFLKTQYSTTLLSAIQESDPASQQKLISNILQINTELSDQIKGILTDLNQGSGSFNPKTLDDLTQDLIEYQRQYQEIQNNKDKVKTLKLIYGSNKEKLKETTFMYNIYLAVLIILILLVVYFVLKTSFVSDAIETISTQVAGRRRR